MGAVAVGSNTNVAPAFGQATVAGHGLVACVGASGAAEPTITGAGWTKVVSVNPGGGSWLQIWVKPNCGAGEAAPSFQQAGGSTPMFAQLSEWSGMATAAPQEATGSASTNGTVLTVAASTADAAFGDLVVVAGRWVLSGSSPGTFADVGSNGAPAPTHFDALGSSSGAFRQASFNYYIVPAAVAAQPLGVAPWAYDVTGTSAPATGTVASVVLAATPGKTYTCAAYSGEVAQTGATADAGEPLQLKDGTNILAIHRVGAAAGAGNTTTVERQNVAYKGTQGNSMTIVFGGAGATSLESVSIGAYLR